MVVCVFWLSSSWKFRARNGWGSMKLGLHYFQPLLLAHLSACGWGMYGQGQDPFVSAAVAWILRRDEEEENLFSQKVYSLHRELWKRGSQSSPGLRLTCPGWKVHPSGVACVCAGRSYDSRLEPHLSSDIFFSLANVYAFVHFPLDSFWRLIGQARTHMSSHTAAASQHRIPGAFPCHSGNCPLVHVLLITVLSF